MPFIFNQHEVCTNPKIVFEAGKDQWNRTEIRVAEDKGQWFYGFSCSYKDGGSSSPVSRAPTSWKPSYATETAAKKAAITYVLKRDEETWYQVNTPQVTELLRLELARLDGRLGVQASLF